jgi:hypothetical protein
MSASEKLDRQRWVDSSHSPNEGVRLLTVCGRSTGSYRGPLVADSGWSKPMSSEHLERRPAFNVLAPGALGAYKDFANPMRCEAPSTRGTVSSVRTQ